MFINGSLLSVQQGSQVRSELTEFWHPGFCIYVVTVRHRGTTDSTYILLLKKASREIRGADSGYVSGHMMSRMNALVSSRSPICWMTCTHDVGPVSCSSLNCAGNRTHPKLEGNRTDFLETLIPLIDGAKSFQLHLQSMDCVTRSFW